MRGVKGAVLLPSLPVAILATMTRAVWLSFAGSMVALLFLPKNHLSKNSLLRAGAALVLIAGAGMVVVLSSPDLAGTLSDRLEERGPVDYREAVYAGGWQMFLS